MTFYRLLSKILLSIYLLTFVNISVYPGELITGFEEDDVPIVNEELRKLDVGISGNTSDIATNTTNIASNTTAIIAIGGAGETIKGWVVFDGTDANPITKGDGYNVAGTIAKNATGDYTVSWDTDFGSANYCVTASAKQMGNNGMTVVLESLAVGTTQITVRESNSDTKTDSDVVCIMATGNQ